MSSQPTADPPTTRVWSPPTELGYREVLRGLGGIVAPLLAGFSLSAIATLLTADSTKTPPHAAWAIVAFAIAVSLLLFSMQVSAIALARGTSPEDYLMWYPEATVSEAALEYARKRQAAQLMEVRRHWGPSGRGYDFGLTAFLAGVLALLIPEDWSPPRTIAVAVTAAALLAELWWALANLFPRRVAHPLDVLLPAKKTADVLADVGAVPVAQLERVSLAAVLNADRRGAAGLQHPLGREASEDSGLPNADREELLRLGENIRALENELASLKAAAESARRTDRQT